VITKVFTLHEWGIKMARKTYGKVFRTKRGVVGQYVYVNGKRVGFQRMGSSFSKRNYDYPKRRY